MATVHRPPVLLRRLLLAGGASLAAGAALALALTAVRAPQAPPPAPSAAPPAASPPAVAGSAATLLSVGDLDSAQVERLNRTVMAALAQRGHRRIQVHPHHAAVGMLFGQAEGLAVAVPPEGEPSAALGLRDALRWTARVTADGAVVSLQTAPLGPPTPAADERILWIEAEAALVLRADVDGRALALDRWSPDGAGWGLHWDPPGPAIAAGTLVGDVGLTFTTAPPSAPSARSDLEARAWAQSWAGTWVGAATDSPPPGATRRHWPAPRPALDAAVAEADWRLPTATLRLHLAPGVGVVADDGRRPEPEAAPPRPPPGGFQADPEWRPLPAPAASTPGGVIAAGRVLRPPQRGLPTLAVDARGRAAFGLWDGAEAPGPWAALRQGGLAADDTRSGPAAGFGLEAPEADPEAAPEADPEAVEDRPAALSEVAAPVLRGVTVAAGGTARARTRLVAAGVPPPHLVYPLGVSDDPLDDRWWAGVARPEAPGPGALPVASEQGEPTPTLQRVTDAGITRWHLTACRARWRWGPRAAATRLRLEPEPGRPGAAPGARGVALAPTAEGGVRWWPALAAPAEALHGRVIFDAEAPTLVGPEVPPPQAETDAPRPTGEGGWAYLVVGTDAAGQGHLLWAPSPLPDAAWARQAQAAGWVRALWVDHDGAGARRWRWRADPPPATDLDTAAGLNVDAGPAAPVFAAISRFDADNVREVFFCN